MLKKIPHAARLILCPSEPGAEPPLRLRLSALTQDSVKALRGARGQIAAVILRDGKPRAFDARCPHMGAPLETGRCVSGDLICPWHGYRFSGESGALLENPNHAVMKTLRLPSASFNPELKPNYRLREYPLTITDGWIALA